MKINFKNTPKQLELIKAMASKDKDVAYKAQLALANFVTEAIAKGLDQAPVLSNLFKKVGYNADDNPSIPLDLFYDISSEDYIDVWHQSSAGGLGYNQVTPTDHELKMISYTIETAQAFDRKHAARSRGDVVAQVFSKIAQEILIHKEKSSANILLGALAIAETNGLSHVQRAEADAEFKLHDFNTLVTLADLIDVSFNGGTPVTESSEVTELLVSPLMAQKVREMAYNPISTDGNHVGSEKFRDGVFAGGGNMSFYDINIRKFKEFGIGKTFNKVFEAAATAASKTYAPADGGTATAFVEAEDEILVGVNRSKAENGALLNMIAVDQGTNSTLDLAPDDQFAGRQKMIGFYGGMEEARAVVDNRCLFGTIVKSNP